MERMWKLIGRIRLNDEDDVWEEWFGMEGSKPVWIEESFRCINLLRKRADNFCIARL